MNVTVNAKSHTFDVEPETPLLQRAQLVCAASYLLDKMEKRE